MEILSNETPDEAVPASVDEVVGEVDEEAPSSAEEQAAAADDAKTGNEAIVESAMPVIECLIDDNGNETKAAAIEKVAEQPRLETCPSGIESSADNSDIPTSPRIVEVDSPSRENESVIETPVSRSEKKTKQNKAILNVAPFCFKCYLLVFSQTGSLISKLTFD